MAENFVKRLNYDPIGGATSATAVAYDNDASGLTADNVQDAIDEIALDGDVQQSELDQEIADRIAADDALDDRIDQEIIDRTADVDAEEARALAAEALLIPLTQKGAALGVVPLNASSQVDPIYLPSYVDDVLEFADLASFPVTGETGKIYVALDTNKTYRWSGSAYIEISPSEVTTVFGRAGDVVSTAGDYTASQVTNVPAGNLAATEVQAALNELQTDIDTRALDSDLNTEITDRTNADIALQDDIDDHINDTTGAHEASAISNIPSGNLAATDVQTALDELQTDIDTRALDADLDAEISRATIAEALVQTNLDNHISDATDAHDASAISSIPAGNLAATDVQGALNELQTDIDTRALDSDLDTEIARATAAEDLVQDNLDNHINDATDAHDATAISYDGTVSTLTSTNVQDAIDELTNRPSGSPGDIQETTFTLASSQTDAPVTGLYFNPADIRSFEVLMSVEIDSSLFECVKITGIQKAADFTISIKSTGDISGVTFDVTNLGQVTYSSPSLTTGFVAFRAIVTNKI